MSLDTLVAILVLVAAVYAILPLARRLELRLRLLKIDWVLIIAALVAAHILLFYSTLRYKGILPEWPFDEKFLSLGQTAYLFLLLVVLFVGIRAYLAPLARGRVFHLQDLVDELIRSESYAELFSLLDKNLKRLCRINNQNFFLPLLRSRLEDPYHSTSKFAYTRLLAELREDQPQRPKLTDRLPQPLRRATSRLGYFVARLLPTYERHAVAAGDILHQILVSQPVVAAVARLRPYFAIRLLQVDLHERHDFLDLYLRLLLEDRHSVLYFELRSNQNMDSNHRYLLPKSNRLLYFFFSDAHRAKSLSVWSPMGEALISRLDEFAINPATDPYNRPMGDFHERGKWEDPLFVGIFFFDVMVSLALHQGVTWHMWLYYFPEFVKRIVRNYRIADSLVADLVEWPTRYSFILRQIVGALTAWLEAAKAIPEDQENVKIQFAPLEPENGNIPKSAAVALTDCLREILLAEQIPARFRNDLMDSVLHTYFDLRSDPKTEKLAEVLRFRMSARSYRNMDDHRRFLQALGSCFAAHDKFHYSEEHIQEFADLLARGLEG